MECLLNAMDIQVKRRGHRVNVRGVLTEQEGTEFSIKGNLQPERNLRVIRETFGSHIEAAIKIYSETRLRVKESDGDADLILYDGREWEVAENRHYDILIPHYKIIAILRKDER